MHRMCLMFAPLLALSLAGCAVLAPGTRVAEPMAECQRFYETLDERIDASGARDAGAARVSGYPYLRTDRFLASYAARQLDPAARRQWLLLLLDLDRQARRIEIQNLPAQQGAVAERRVVEARLAECAPLVQAHVLSEPREHLDRRVTVPDDYNTFARTLGAYPLTAVFVRQGALRTQRDLGRAFTAPADARSAQGELTRFLPAANRIAGASAIRDILARSTRNPLGIPLPDAADAAVLFETFAPVLEIAAQGPFDTPGTPSWAGRGLPTVDTARPAAYRALAHTRLGSLVLLQLEYVFWFSDRPARGLFDLLAGRLDGITYRVTLDPDGRPMMYDIMHNCGCYHLVLPGPRLRPRLHASDETEPLWIPQAAPFVPAAQRVLIRLASGTHYVQKVTSDGTRRDGQHYQIMDYDVLRSLPWPAGGRRSLFDRHGLVPGTARAERFLLWPMGIDSPGAMRQRGRHATAFVGRRHFDDPRLIERYFDFIP